MIVMVSAQQQMIDGQVESRFGRSPFLIKYDTGTKKWQAFSNPGASQSGGAGVAAAQFAIDQKADAVISGEFGPNAARVFQAAKIKMLRFSDDISTVEQAIDQLLRGTLSEANWD
jgi:predicted Fe-Mo cluster-binding NifX family protein